MDLELGAGENRLMDGMGWYHLFTQPEELVLSLHRRRGNGQNLKELHFRKTEKLSTSTAMGSTWINVVERWEKDGHTHSWSQTKASRNGHAQWDSFHRKLCYLLLCNK